MEAESVDDLGVPSRRDRVSERFSSLNRRDVIKAGVFAGAAVALPAQRAVSARSVIAGRMAASKLPKPFTLPFSIPPVAMPYKTYDGVDYYKIWMSKVNKEIIPGFQTPVYAYNGSVPGPTIKTARHRPAIIRFYNNLPPVHEQLGYEQWTSVHLHGSASLPQFDGYTSDVTRPGQYKDYVYPNMQPARTLWYHDHGVHHTAENCYYGLYAQYHMTDDEDQALPLPKGEYDVPLTIVDAMFQSDGQLLFSLADNSGMYGDVILVNGTPWPAMKVKRRKYRFRILNASASRSYNYSLDTGDNLTVIGTDGGLMSAPQSVKSVRHGMAERYEVIIDFSKYKAGKRVILKNTSPKNNVNFTNTNKIMAFDVVGDAFDPSNNTVPPVLSTNSDTMSLTVADATVTDRVFDFKRQGGEWTINDMTWKDVVDSDFTYTMATVNYGDVEMWTLKNLSGGWFHPAHIHLIDFKILDRNGKPPFAYERGAKDVVYIGENETVRILARFDGNLGKYMIHCHNLVHEDHDMMTQYEVVADGSYGYDPLSWPCKNQDEEDEF